MPDPKPKKRKNFSKDPDDIMKTVNRDYPGYKARYLGKDPDGRSNFKMRSVSNGSSFTLNRGSAFPAVDKELAKQARLKYNRNKNK